MFTLRSRNRKIFIRPIRANYSGTPAGEWLIKNGLGSSRPNCSTKEDCAARRPRGDDDYALSIARIKIAAGQRPPRLAPGHRQQQNGPLLERTTYPALVGSKLLDDRLIYRRRAELCSAAPFFRRGSIRAQLRRKFAQPSNPGHIARRVPGTRRRIFRRGMRKFTGRVAIKAAGQPHAPGSPGKKWPAR